MDLLGGYIVFLFNEVKFDFIDCYLIYKSLKNST